VSSFGLYLHESPKWSIREIETHEVCPGRETAPGFFHVGDPPSRAGLDAQQGESQMTFEKAKAEIRPATGRAQHGRHSGRSDVRCSSIALPRDRRLFIFCY
jgi:hypothetical protein